MTALTFLILGLAAYRAARAVAIDTITEPVRLWLESKPSRVARWFDELVGCPFCCGFWISGITYLVYVLVTPPSHTAVMLHLIYWWAVAGLQAVLTAVDSSLSEGH